MNAEECIKAGDLEAALKALQAAIRDDPSKPELRTFLFQLLSVKGDWNKALTQLNVVADMDSSTLLMAQTYRELLQCEAFRADVFTGKRAPLLFGEPNAWLGTLMQALSEAHNGNGEKAGSIVMQAMDLAVARSGTVDEQSFDWLSDADMRLGPVFEIILNGKYYWAPMENVAEISFSEPEDLRDLVWLPVQIQWQNESRSIGFMPTRYPGNATLDDPQSALARKTEWANVGGNFFTGSGQRMFSSNDNEYSLLQTRKIVFDTADQASVVDGSTD